MIGEIENAIVQRIDTATLGYKPRKVATYGAEFSMGLERIVRDFPAFLVAYQGGELMQERRSSFKFSARFTVICCANSLRNEAAARQGAGSGVGSYQMAQDVVRLLSGRTLDLSIDPIRPTAIQALINDRADQQLASVYGVELTTAFNFDLAPNPATIDDFETFHANWDIPVHGNVDKNIPSDDSADATDHITLETEE